MNAGIFGYENRTPGRANSLQVITTQHDAAGQKEMEARLLRHFEDAGFNVRSTQTSQTLNAQNGLMFDVIVGFLILMAVLLGAVGSLGLSTTMGINMMERIREIGVLRAIGASNGAIWRIVLLEGLAIATISWSDWLCAVVPDCPVHGPGDRHCAAGYAVDLHLRHAGGHRLVLHLVGAGGGGQPGPGPRCGAADHPGGIGV